MITMTAQEIVDLIHKVIEREKMYLDKAYETDDTPLVDHCEKRIYTLRLLLSNIH